MFTLRRTLISVALLATAAAFALAVWPDPVTTGSIGLRPEIVPTQGNISQDGRVVGWATGARRRDGIIAFDAITDTKRFEPSRKLDFAGYTLSVLQVRIVRYSGDDPATDARFEQVVTEIKSTPAK
ncbi:MAG: hypothetical protein JO000_04890 [Alphaproteobacteria bacterium]|nr:hypothetical protein [Alphaproteobacteria bacterium]